MRVLVVEDDRALGAFLKTGMELEGHRVEWVEDGEAALTEAAADPSGPGAAGPEPAEAGWDGGAGGDAGAARRRVGAGAERDATMCEARVQCLDMGRGRLSAEAVQLL